MPAAVQRFLNIRREEIAPILASALFFFNLIAGGGIGGLAAGIALQRRGFEAHVFEAAPVLQAVGAGVLQALDASEIVSRLGFLNRRDPALGAAADPRVRAAAGFAAPGQEAGPLREHRPLRAKPQLRFPRHLCFQLAF